MHYFCIKSISIKVMQRSLTPLNVGQYHNALPAWEGNTRAGCCNPSRTVNAGELPRNRVVICFIKNVCTIFLFGGEAGWQIEDSQSGLKVQNK